VIDADAAGDPGTLRFWPQLQDEVGQWRFTPFEKNGRAVSATVEEYIDLVPPERLPKAHVQAPTLHVDSKIAITLEKGGCLGSCPIYTVTIANEGILFDGRGYVVAAGKHTDTIDPAVVRNLAKRFVAADFFSMDASYAASVTDCPGFVLSISIDDHTKKVTDYMGSWVGMPAVITDLEDSVDELARTKRWVSGTDGLVDALHAENFKFHSFAAQVMLKEVATRGETATLQGLLAAGVPLVPLPDPRAYKPYEAPPFEQVGWLTAASRHPETLNALIDAGASNNDQNDKDLALAGAAQSGKVEAVRALIAYGANPNADLSKRVIIEDSGGMELGSQGASSILIYAATSGNPDMVRELLRYRPNLEARDREGKTAVFHASEWRNDDEDGARVQCVRLLVEAGANVNARDNDGNTPLHETFLTDVEEELLKLGADVNARNSDGETPIFTTVDDDAIPLFIRYGADLTIRNNKGETVFEAAKNRGPVRQEALRKATEKAKRSE
jgi:ankyrin repeat protein